MINSNIISKDKIHTLTGLRAFAALWVVIYNMNRFEGVDPGFVRNIDWGIYSGFLNYGYTGVDFFFFLSGFVISYVYQDNFSNNLKKEVIIRYYKLRLARIYPLHFSILVLIIILSLQGVFPYNLNIKYGPALLNLTLTDSWGIYSKGSWNAPAWSLSAEWFIYLLYPFIAFMLIREETVKYYLKLLITISMIFFVLNLDDSNTTEIDDGAGGLIRVTFGFITGCILFNFYKNNVLKKLPWDIIGILTFIIMFMSQITLPDETMIVNVISYICITIFVYSLVYSRNILKFIFANKLSVYLGKISFAIFLLHMPVMKILGHNFRAEFINLVEDNNQPDMILYLLISLAILLIFSSLCYHLIENPCRNYIKKRVNKNR